MKTEIESPKTTQSGLTFFPVPEFDRVTEAFGAKAECYFDRRKLPKVPRKYEDMVHTLFFQGGNLPEMRKCVDPQKAKAALMAWLRSFAPAHESKVATAAYALWVWCEMEEQP